MSPQIFRIFCFGVLYNLCSFSKLHLRFDKILSNYRRISFLKQIEGSGGLVVKVSALNPDNMGSGPNRVTTMFLHMILALFGSRQRTRKLFIFIERLCLYSS
jgi:hypothetical protein